MILCNSANQLKRSEGVEAQTAKFAENVGVGTCQRFADCLCISVLLGPAGVDEKHLFPTGRMVSGKFQNVLLKFGVVNAGGKSNQVLFFQIFRRRFRYIEKGDLVRGGTFDGIQ